METAVRLLEGTIEIWEFGQETRTNKLADPMDMAMFWPLCTTASKCGTEGYLSVKTQMLCGFFPSNKGAAWIFFTTDEE